MCSRINCERCGKPTFAGCGRHVEQVLGNVPPAKRCRCAADAPVARDDSKGWWPWSK